MEQQNKPRILIYANDAGVGFATKLCEVIGEWAMPDIWNDVTTEGELKTLAFVEGALDMYDACVFLLVNEDIIKIHDDELQDCSGLLLNILLSYAYIGRRNTFVAIRPSNNPYGDVFIRKVTDLLRVINPIVFDFMKSIELFAFELKNRWFIQSPAGGGSEFYNKPKNREKIKRVGTTKAEDLKNPDGISETLSARIALAEPKLEEQAVAVQPTPPSFVTETDNIEITTIETYKYPDLNNEKYEFALIKRGEEVLLTDQGITLERLDQIFELREPDVIKNLVAILRQFGGRKIGNLFAIKLENWDGNTNEEESEALKKARLLLFSCVSFMYNMKIFYI